MARKVFGSLGRLSFSLGMFKLIFGITTVICVSFNGVVFANELFLLHFWKQLIFSSPLGLLTFVLAVPDRIHSNSGLLLGF